MKLANSGIGPVIVQFGLFTTALASLNKVLQKGNVFSQITSSFGGLKTAISGVASGATTLGAAFKGSSLLMSGGIVAAGMAIVGLISLVEKLNVTYEEQAQKVDELQAEYDSLYGEGGEMARLEAAEFLIDADQRRLDILKMQEASLAEQLRIAKQLEFDKFNQENPLTYMEGTPGMTGIGVQTSKSLVDKWAKEFDDLNKQLEGGVKTPEEYSKALLGLYDQLDDNVEMYRENKEAGNDLSDEQERAIAIAEQMEAAFAEQGGEITTTSNALQTYINKIRELEDLKAGQQEISGITKELNELIEAGEVGSPALEKIWGIISDKAAAEAGYDSAVALDNLKTSLGAMLDEDPVVAASAFQDALYGLNGVLGESGEALVTVDENGNLMLGSLSDLASEFGLNEEKMQDFIFLLQQYSSQQILTSDQLADFDKQLDELGTTSEATGSKVLKGPVEALQDIQQVTGASTTSQLKRYVQALQAAGEIDLYDTEEQLDALLASMELIQTSGGIVIDTSTPNGQATIEELTKMNLLSGDEEKDVDVIANTKKALNAVGAVDAKKIDDKLFYVDAAGTALGTLQQILNYYNSLQNKTVRITTVYTTVNERGFSHSGGVFATGTTFTPGGETLINDGTPVNGSAAEIVAYNGHAQIFNDGEPTIVDMPRGATVYNATDTQKILNSGINAFATGTPFAPIQFPTSSPSSIATSDSAWSEAVAGTTVSSAKTKEEYEKWLKAKKHALAMDEITEEQYYLELEKMNEEYVNNITDYQDEYWRNMEDIYKWRKQQQDELNGSLEQQIELERALGELAKTKENQLLVYKDGRMQYLSNIDAISEARLGVLEAAGGSTSALASLATANYGGLGTQGTNGVQWIFDINNINLSEVTDVPGFIEGLKNLAYQYSYKRA